METPIVIVTYNNRSSIIECLDSVIRNQSDAAIVIVDNHSLDETVDRINQWKNDHPSCPITLIRNEENTGFARAVNQGAQHILSRPEFPAQSEARPVGRNIPHADFFLLLNPDAILDASTIHHLTSEALTDSKIAIVAPKLTSAAGAVRWSIGRFPTFLRIAIQALWRSTSWGWIITNPNEYTFTHDVAWAAGTCWLVRKQAWKEMDGFDPEYFLYIEDVDLCRRLRSRRWRIRFVPQARLIHHQQVSVGPIILKANKWELNGLLYYYQTAFPTHQWRLKLLRWLLMSKWTIKKVMRHGFGPL